MTPPLRIVIYGNSGAGKTTMARQLQRQHDLPRLVLDSIAWEADWGYRRPLDSSIEELRQFISAHDCWIIEGCYGNLIEAALPWCSELRFLNPGIDVCVANCRRRHADWEQDQRPDDERSPLEELLPWLYLKGISTGDFKDALQALLGPDAGSLSASTITRLKAAWEDEQRDWAKRSLKSKTL